MRLILVVEEIQCRQGRRARHDLLLTTALRAAKT